MDNLVMPSVVEREYYFEYLKVQPGDGTIYTVIYGNMPNKSARDGEQNWYMAIGPGDNVQGGYFFKSESLLEMLKELEKHAIGVYINFFEFTKQYHLFGYYQQKLNNGPRWNWTAAVAPLILCCLLWSDYDFSLVEGVYTDDRQMVIEWLNRWFNSDLVA